MWNGRFFEQSNLLTNGLTLDLRHYPDNCPSIHHNTEIDPPTVDLSDESDEFSYEHEPSADSEPTANVGSRSNIIIVSSTGIFTRSIQWCHCAKSPRQYAQLLLRAKLFLASFKNPKTAFTFEVLDHFRIDSLECKTAVMNFMSKIGRVTNEAFPAKVPVSCPIDWNVFRHWPSDLGPLSRTFEGLTGMAGSAQSDKGWCCPWLARQSGWWWLGAVLPCLSADWYQYPPRDRMESEWQVSKSINVTRFYTNDA